MKQYPSRLKYKKNHKVKSSFFIINSSKKFYPMFGNFGLKSVESGKLTYNQIEAGRKTIRRSVKKAGSLWIRAFTNKSVTRKALATRMGKGKGNHSFWMCPVKSGEMIYELSGLTNFMSNRALKRSGFKLPFRSRVVKLTY